MSITPRALIADCLYELNVYATGESISAADEALAFRHANRMIDRWATQRLTMQVILRTTKTLTSSTTSYTIGTGGSINIVRPTYIQDAAIVLDSTATDPIEIPIAILTDQEYAQWSIKSLGVSPATAIWYNRAWVAGLGTIYILPVPTTSTTQLVLYTPTALTPFADLTTALTFAPGYEDCLFYNLTKRLQTPFARKASPDTLEQARESLADIKRGNFRMRELSIPRALVSTGRRSATASSFASGTF